MNVKLKLVEMIRYDGVVKAEELIIRVMLEGDAWTHVFLFLFIYFAWLGQSNQQQGQIAVSF